MTKRNTDYEIHDTSHETRDAYDNRDTHCNVYNSRNTCNTRDTQARDACNTHAARDIRDAHNTCDARHSHGARDAKNTCAAKNTRGAIDVAVGLVFNAHRDILIAQRIPPSPQSGLWEFPGGKVEPGETVYEALCRELQEEVAVSVITATEFGIFPYAYQDLSVNLHTWIVTEFSGQVIGQEGQPLAWVALEDLDTYTFPAGNARIIDRLRYY